ncbi:MAG TPA: hypothetical protein VGG07_25175 [Solirubrobacteraceae bacterium]|jgi:hypothetical protein
MAERVLQYTATIPAGTAIDAPATVTFPLDGWDIETIDLQVPPGPAGTMGFYLANNGLPWVPRNNGEWLVWDDEKLTVIPTGYPSGSGWGVTGYNLGNWDHAVIVRFHVNPVAYGAPANSPYVITFIEHDVKPHTLVVI